MSQYTPIPLPGKSSKKTRSKSDRPKSGKKDSEDKIAKDDEKQKKKSKAPKGKTSEAKYGLSEEFVVESDDVGEPKPKKTKKADASVKSTANLFDSKDSSYGKPKKPESENVQRSMAVQKDTGGISYNKKSVANMEKIKTPPTSSDEDDEDEETTEDDSESTESTSTPSKTIPELQVNGTAESSEVERSESSEGSDSEEEDPKSMKQPQTKIVKEEKLQDDANNHGSEDESEDESEAEDSTEEESEYESGISDSEIRAKATKSSISSSLPVTMQRSSTQSKDMYSADQRRPAPPFRPPPGFKDVVSSSSSSNSTKSFQVFQPSNLVGKQLWYFTAPSSLPIKSLEEVSMEAIEKGEAVITHQDSQYGFISSNETPKGSITVMLPSNGSYKPVPVVVKRSLHLQQIVRLSKEGQSRGDESQSRDMPDRIPTGKKKRVQPKGLRMRYKPSGFGDGDPGTLGSSDEGDDTKEKNKAQFQIPRLPVSDSLNEDVEMKKNKNKKRKDRSEEEPTQDSPRKKKKKKKQATSEKPQLSNIVKDDTPMSASTSHDTKKRKKKSNGEDS